MYGLKLSPLLDILFDILLDRDFLYSEKGVLPLPLFSYKQPFFFKHALVNRYLVFVKRRYYLELVSPLLSLQAITHPFLLKALHN